jgi:DNA-binding NtrC family response regulator
MVTKKGYNILIVDDEIEYQKVLSLILSGSGYDIATCSNGVEALEFIENNMVDLVLTDLQMPVMNGVELIKQIKKKYGGIDIIVMTAFGSIESAVDSIKYGATDYFVKTGNLKELEMKVERLAKINYLERKNSILVDKENSKESFMNSKNKKFLELIEMCKRTADTNINILLLGESGVGKEVIANYIHKLSNRGQEAFVAINCQVFPEGIIDSELFGHEKGSFTGATVMRIGKFEQASYGTLFLDEIGDLPIATQGKLLRAIESRKIERLGSNKSINLDVRFISATNKDLTQLIGDGHFRDDLFYRINTLTLTIPPLRERREDLPELINFFIRKIERDQKKKIHRVDDEVMKFLLQYNYPGNIRELKNIIERMIALSRDGIVTVNEIMMPVKKTMTDKVIETYDGKAFKEARSFFEEKFIKEALKHNNGNVAKTAVKMEISTRQLWNKINQYNINTKTANKFSV